MFHKLPAVHGTILATLASRPRHLKDVCISALVICALTIIFEGLKAVKSFVKLRQQKRRSVAGEEDYSNEFGLEITSMHAELITVPSSSGLQEIKRRKFFLFLFESFIHMFNAFFGYIFMLLVMTYSVWFLMAVVVGSAVGFFISRPVLEHLTSEYSLPKDREGDHYLSRTDRHEEGSINNYTPGIHQVRLEILTH